MMGENVLGIISAFELGVRTVSLSQFDFGGMRSHSFPSVALSSAKRSSSSSSVNAGPCILVRCEARSVRRESSRAVVRGGRRTENLCDSLGLWSACNTYKPIKERTKVV